MSGKAWNAWYDLLPASVAKAQVIHERNRAIFRAYQAGATPLEIAKRAGISRVRVDQIIHRSLHRHRGYRPRDVTPMKTYFMQNADLARTEHAARLSR